jgi:hypothetical protein
MERSDEMLHTPEHEALWGLAGTRRETALLWSGDFLVELVQYLDPVGAPWPDGYRISDQGILNIALGGRSRAAYQAATDAVVAAGHTVNRARSFPFGDVNYVMDKQGFSVELFFLDESADALMGFLPEQEAP